MIKWIFLGIYYFLVMIITEKVVTNIDKKERALISMYEKEFIEQQEKIFTNNKNFDFAVRKKDEDDSYNINNISNISSSGKSRSYKM